MLLTNNNRNEINIVKTHSVDSFKKMFRLSKIYIANNYCYLLSNEGTRVDLHVMFNKPSLDRSTMVVSKISYRNYESYMIHSIYDYTINECDFIEICKEKGINPFDEKFRLDIHL